MASVEELVPISRDDDAPYDEEIRRQAFRFTANLLIPSSVFTLTAATILGLIARDEIEPLHFYIWLSLIWLGGGSRIATVLAYRRNANGFNEYRSYANLLTAVQTAAGIFLGSLVLLPKNQLDLKFLAIYLLVIGGITVSGPATYVGAPKALIATMVTLFAPVLWLLLGSDTSSLRLLGCIVALHPLVILAMQKTSGRTFRETMLLRFENLRLAERLAERSAAASNALADAQQAVHERIRFMATASHDLRQPVHALSLFLAAHRAEKDPTKRHAYEEKLELSVAGLQLQLDRLLDVSQLDANAVRLRNRSFSLRSLEDSLTQTFALQAAERKLRLKFRLREVEIYSDPFLVFQILQNLVANALRYTQAGGVLVVSRRRGEQVLIQVWDTGVGISKEHLPKIFGLFQRGETASPAHEHGVGLGLAIVARLSELLGTKVDVQSRPGKGTVFSVLLPRKEASAPKRNNPSKIEGDGSPTRGHGAVLIVDDHVLAREALASLVQAWGFKAHTSGTVNGAKELCSLHRDIGALISDYHLAEGETGIKVAQDSQNVLERSIPTLILTGSGTPSTIQRELEPGTEFETKPIAPERLRRFLLNAFKDLEP